MLFLFVGNKSELVTLLKRMDKEFLIKYLIKDILPLQQWLVKTKMGHSVLTSEEDGRTVVSTINGFDVTKECFRKLGVHVHAVAALLFLLLPPLLLLSYDQCCCC
jgi:hypothetical protein